MSDAASRLAALDSLPAAELCARARDVLDALATLMNEETMLLRAGRYHDTSDLTSRKTTLAQDYVALARAVQREAGRLAGEAPDAFGALRSAHDRLATQMAENLKVVATLKRVTDDLLTDVAQAMARRTRAETYSKPGTPTSSKSSSGIAINRAL